MKHNNNSSLGAKLKPHQKWNQINWVKVEKFVLRLERSIAKAVEHHDFAKVAKLRRIFRTSNNVRLLSVRRVTQDNRGKRTAGVDGKVITSEKERWRLASNVSIDGKSNPLLRVWIPKSNSKELRPLGIPTIEDRVKQMMLKLEIEPIYEVQAEPNVYGFRPARSVHDAIEACFIAIGCKKEGAWVLEGDFSKFFDNINKEHMLKMIKSLGITDKETLQQVQAWIKSGVIDKEVFTKTDKGTPQGGVISPLLANIALHGMENMLHDWVNTWKGTKRRNHHGFSVIRYADDFVVIHKDRTVIEEAKQRIEEWLDNGVGVKLNQTKTKITHTTKGFDFLGFNVRQYRVNNGSKLKFLTKPSKDKVIAHMESIRQVTKTMPAVSTETLIAKLNPIITGWSNYYSSAASKKTLNWCDNQMFIKLWKWATRRHNDDHKCKRWIKNKYFKRIGTRNWVFATVDDKGKPIKRLKSHSKTKIVRHVKVRGTKHVYDGDNIYWAKRNARNPLLPTRVKKLLFKQEGVCPYCGSPFKNDDIMEIDHVIPKSEGGKDIYLNLQLLHDHCHDNKTLDDKRRFEKELLTKSDWVFV